MGILSGEKDVHHRVCKVESLGDRLQSSLSHRIAHLNCLECVHWNVIQAIGHVVERLLQSQSHEQVRVGTIFLSYLVQRKISEWHLTPSNKQNL